MERGRSPSAGQANNHISHSASASPHPHPHLSSSYTGLDNGNTHPDYSGLNLQATSGAFTDPTFTQDFSQQAHYSLDPSFTNYSRQQQHPAELSQNDALSNSDYLQSQSSQHSGTNNSSANAFPSIDFQSSDFEQSLDPSFLGDLESVLAQQSTTDATSASFNPMATAMHPHSPTPPHHFLDMTNGRRQSASPSPHASPNFQQQSFQPMSRPRNASESLDPSSAMYPAGQNEWTGMGPYRSHKRTPSDNLSDISSNNPSPYMASLDAFDASGAHSSPLLHSMQDPTFNDGLGLGNFNLNEMQLQQQNYHSPGHSPHNYHTPAHSPGHSPRMMPQPQQALPHFTADNNFGLNANFNGAYGQQANGLEMFPGAGDEAFPSFNSATSPGEMGQADHMSPPEISIFHVPSVEVDNVQPELTGDALSPPARIVKRERAKSDSHAGSRAATPGMIRRGRSPSLQPSSAGDSLFPPSRSPSPAISRGRNGSLGDRARAGSAASDQRDYILDLAIPERTPSSDKNNKRTQKHPATFQCDLCPKRFTRAYNLRSHLRTHTDERPFVCTHCGKAFARQHDRKRHEGLHSGEKKFVCSGSLQAGSKWGCGRRFARADALGRHFRSEAGRICIKPLLDEEAAERQRRWMEEQHQQNAAPLLSQPPIDSMGNFLPAALLQQYPALAGIDWSTVPQGNPPPEDDYNGRSSFDASSGGEYYEDLSENEMGAYSNQNMSGMNGMNGMHDLNGMNININVGLDEMGMNHSMQARSGATHGFYGNQTGDYLSDFEGR